MRKAIGALAAGGLAALALAAASASAAVSALAPADQALFDYAKCMRGKGVKIPDPVKAKDGTYSFPAISKAITAAAGVREKAQACAQSSGALRNRGNGGNGGGAGGDGSGQAGGGRRQSPEFLAAFAKFTACMKSGGVTVPTPGQRPPGTQGGQGGQRAQGGRPGAATTGSALRRAGTTTGASGSKPVVDPKTGKTIARPTILGQGPEADDDAQEGFRGGDGTGRRGPGGGLLGGLTDTPKVQAALAKCRALLPQGAFGPRGGPGGQGGQRPAAAGTTAAAKTTARK